MSNTNDATPAFWTLILRYMQRKSRPAWQIYSFIDKKNLGSPKAELRVYIDTKLGMRISE